MSQNNFTRKKNENAGSVLPVCTQYYKTYGFVGTGEIGLAADGYLIIDGQRYAPNENLYLNNGFFSRDVPVSLIDKKLESGAGAGIANGVIANMNKINRNIAPIGVMKKLGDNATFDDLLDVPKDKYSDVAINYKAEVKRVDAAGISGEKEIRRFIATEQVKKDCLFCLDGYLHVEDDVVDLTNDQINALREFRALGGRIGKTILDLLTKMAEEEEEDSTHGIH